MKKIVLAALAAVMFAIPAGSQTVSRFLTFQVPFGFFVGDAEMTAGEYTVARLPATGIILVRSEKDGAMMSSHPAIAKAPERGSLVFNKYPGDRYFLAELWYPGSDTGAAMIKTRREREQVSSMLISGVRPERVVVMMTRGR